MNGMFINVSNKGWKMRKLFFMLIVFYTSLCFASITENHGTIYGSSYIKQSCGQRTEPIEPLQDTMAYETTYCKSGFDSTLSFSRCYDKKKCHLDICDFVRMESE